MNFQSIGAPVQENAGVFTAACDALYPAAAKTVLFDTERAPENFAFSCEIKLCEDGEAGMYFRAQGKNGAAWVVGYFFSVNAADGAVKISKINGGDRDPLIRACGTTCAWKCAARTRGSGLTTSSWTPTPTRSTT